MDPTTLDAILSNSVSFSYKTTKNVRNSKTIEPNKTQIIEIGQLNKKKLLVSCDGNGNFRIRDIGKWKDQLKELEKLRDKISKKEYEKVRQRILEDLD